jgi:ATP citrate (pro-S)-lyase
LQVESITGTLNNFIVEPFLPHPSNTEYYVCITSAREGDSILFTHEGGVDIGDVDAKALVLNLPVTQPFPSRETIALPSSPTSLPKRRTLSSISSSAYTASMSISTSPISRSTHWLFLMAVNGGEPQVCYLDMAAKLDQTAESICGPKWAIARDLSVYDVKNPRPPRLLSKGSKVSADRGPPMV